MTLLTVHDLTQQYGNHTAVNHIDLSIAAGQLVAFLGPNGAGKSTTFKMLTGITRPKAGTISLNGLPPSDPRYRHQIGVVFQESVLDNALTVKQNLQWRAGMYKHIDPQFIKHLLKVFEIESIMEQKYGTLSGGQRRRVDIVRALLHKPTMLFLDEPSTGLDIQTRNKIWAVLNQLRHQYHLTIMLTTHYLEEANFADYVYVIDHGDIIAADTVSDLKAKYAKDVLTITSNQVDQIKPLLHSNWQTMIDGDRIQMVMPNIEVAIQFLTQVRSLIDTMDYRCGDMNDIFVALTGREIR